MKTVRLSSSTETIDLCDVPEDTPIFAFEKDQPVSMVILEPEGYILRYPKGHGHNGPYNTREDCIKSVLDLGEQYTFKVF